MKALSIKTKLYLISIYLLGLAILVWQMSSIVIDQPALLILLCVLASLALVLKVTGATDNSHYTFSFLVYGFAFVTLGLPCTLIVILVSNIVEWIWNNPKWYGQLFNIGNYFIAMWLASLTHLWINPAASLNTWQTILGIFVSMATFDFLNHLMVGVVVWLATGENFQKSGIFDFFPLMLDLALLVFGASLSIVWHYNAFAILLFPIPLYLIYSTLRVPALERKTEVDPKTGLFNHQYFTKHMTNELARANRFDRPMSVILADLDLLRNINNTYGHLAGDEVLIGIARAMKNALRDYDVVCRFGGEEFAILLPETSLSQAFERAEVIRKTVEELEFIVPTSVTPIRATLSLGVAHRENFSQKPDEIIHNADLALYHSKLSGRNQTFAFSEGTYLDFKEAARETAPSTLQPAAAPVTTEQSLPPLAEPHTVPSEGASADQKIVQPTTGPGTEPQETVRDSRMSPKTAVHIFIGGLGILAVAAVTFLVRWSPIHIASESFDWAGVVVIAVLIALAEGLSVDLYVKQTSISTSAIPILAAYLLFGTTGILLASTVLALALLIKYRSPFSRFVFNLSNHIVAGTLIVGLVVLTGHPFLDIPVTFRIGICLAAAAILYFFTTWMVAIGIGLDLKQHIGQLWQDQFRWLAPYYLGIGLITYALIFGYEHDQITGLLLMVVPMFLLRLSQKQYIDRTQDVVAQLREKNQILKKNAREITDLNEGLLVTLSEIVDLRDPSVFGHSKQVSEYAAQIAKGMGLNEKQTDLIRKAGLLHDIGKVGISREVLSKPGKLTAAEYELVKRHAALGAALIQNSPSLRPLAQIIRHHHEWYDGNGYPDKISGSQISIEARIIAVAEAIEDMTSEKPYHRAQKVDRVKDELSRGSGRQFDPLVVEAAIRFLDNDPNGIFTQPVQPKSRPNTSSKLATDVQTS